MILFCDIVFVIFVVKFDLIPIHSVESESGIQYLLFSKFKSMKMEIYWLFNCVSLNCFFICFAENLVLLNIAHIWPQTKIFVSLKIWCYLIIYDIIYIYTHRDVGVLERLKNIAIPPGFCAFLYFSSAFMISFKRNFFFIPFSSWLICDKFEFWEGNLNERVFG